MQSFPLAISKALMFLFFFRVCTTGRESIGCASTGPIHHDRAARYLYPCF